MKQFRAQGIGEMKSASSSFPEPCLKKIMGHHGSIFFNKFRMTTRVFLPAHLTEFKQSLFVLKHATSVSAQVYVSGGHW